MKIVENSRRRVYCTWKGINFSANQKGNLAGAIISSNGDIITELLGNFIFHTGDNPISKSNISTNL